MSMAANTVLIVISKQTIINLIFVMGGPDLLSDIGVALPVVKHSSCLTQTRTSYHEGQSKGKRQQ
jgi:hypothetical protein